MNKWVLIALLSTNDLYAGTAGNSDLRILFGILMAILFLMLGIDNMIKYLKRRRERLEEERILHEAEGENE